METGASGDRPEGCEAGQLDGTVRGGGTTCGTVRPIVEAEEVDKVPRLRGEDGMDGCGAVGWIAGMEDFKAIRMEL